MKRGWMLAMLAGLAAPAAAAQAPVPPSPEALVDRYMAAIPHNQDEVNAGRAENEVARLLQANPGGDEAAVRAAVGALESCFSSVLNANTDGAIRATVRAMGAEKLNRLIAFYTGPDHAAFAAIVDANEHGEMTEAQRADRRRIESSYPVLEFVTLFSAALDIARRDQAFQREAHRCRGIQAEMLERRGLRLE
ncbi:MAG TPA: hypothetical protein VGO55_04530 [Allosphingosinicella sp.]|nr:hypothetical protein [Allosphingosinicella sp.]